jgi:hypothetical protein
MLTKRQKKEENRKRIAKKSRKLNQKKGLYRKKT